MTIMMTYIRDIYNKGIDHLKQNNMNYWQHLLFACFYSYICLVACLLLIIHAILPCFFQTAGSDLVKKLAQRFNKTT